MLVSLKTLAWAIAVFSLLVFIVLFGQLPAFKDTIVGRAHVLLWQRLPAAAVSLDRRLTGGRLSTGMVSGAKHLVNDKNWAIVGFYLVLFVPALSTFFYRAWPLITGPLDTLMVPLVAFMPLVSLYLAVVTDPGYVTPSNVERLTEIFRYDDIIFYSDQEDCYTCLQRKPARSKHCKVCKRCVAKMDHHCAWINNCVGYYNYRWFLLFVINNLAVMVYGSWLLGSILYADYVDEFFPDGAARPRWFLVDRRKWAKIIHAKPYSSSVTSLFMIAFMVAPLLIAFLAQHIVFLYQGVTTNESEKWNEVEYVVANSAMGVYEYPEPAPASPELRQRRSTPRSSRRVYIHHYRDGDTNRPVPEGMVEVERVRSLEHITNIYDRGSFMANLREVIWPQH
ncbi:DHHC palmitoyltransferase-domain-containing protein [Dipodascopsis tothii]|uniref:DHHC palmitoyltransferase-domain-containing protein n=1 Tax=Dipodascopsis tothii TaxID=44089 RepID=UPI0034CF491C